MKEEMKEYVISRQLLVMTHQLGRVISAVLNDVQSSGAYKTILLGDSMSKV